MFTRREAIYLMGGTVVWIGCGGPELDLGLSDSDSFDDVLDKLHTTDPDLGDGLANHAPMSADALVAMGRSDRVVAFVDEYDENLRLMDRGTVIPVDDRTALRGNHSRRADWIATYESELEGGDPAEIVRRDWPWLAAGMPAVAAHGLLRLGHAVRSFNRQDTTSRRRELAHALGYWAATHETLPGVPGANVESGFGVDKALQELPFVAREQQSFDGTILPRLDGVRTDPAFAALVERLDPEALPVDDALTELSAAAARAIVENGGGFESIALLHGVTSSAILRHVEPWLDDEGRRLAVGHAFQLVAAFIAAQAPRLPREVEPSSVSRQTLVAAAAQSADPHAVKLVDAVLAENDLVARPEYFRAAKLWPGIA